MNDLDTLRASLTSAQRDLLSKIWVYYLKDGQWMPARVLHSTVEGGKQVARPLLEQLGGSVVYEKEENGAPQYALTLLGIMLSSDGNRAEELLASFIQLARQLALQEPVRTKITSHEVDDHLGLTPDELAFLGKVFLNFPSPFSGGGSFPSDNQWEVILPREIEDWPEVIRPFLNKTVLRDYDSSVPLTPNERIAYYADKMRRDITQRTGSRPAQPSVDSKVGPTATPVLTDRVLTVFLCHSSGDKEAVRQLYRRLREAGVRPWLDEEDLLPGVDWDLEIRRAVRGSDVIAMCLSRNSTTKTGYIQKEIRLVLDAADERPEGQIFVMPLKLEECEVPERLRKWQWVNLFEQGGYGRLICALQVRARELDALEPSEPSDSLDVPPAVAPGTGP